MCIRDSLFGGETDGRIPLVSCEHDQAVAVLVAGKLNSPVGAFVKPYHRNLIIGFGLVLSLIHIYKRMVAEPSASLFIVFGLFSHPF